MSITDALEGRLRDYYSAVADANPADGQLRAVLARTGAIPYRSSRPLGQIATGARAPLSRVFSGRAVAWATIALLAALLLMLAAAIAGRPPEPPSDGSSQAIFVRGYEDMELFAVRLDGRERSLGPIPESVAGEQGSPAGWLYEIPRDTQPFVVSPAGRMAVLRRTANVPGEQWSFYTLGDARAAPITVPAARHSWRSGTWNADGDFISGSEPGDFAQWIDSATGATEERPARYVADWLSPFTRDAPVPPEGEFVWRTFHPAWVFRPVRNGVVADQLTVYQSRGARYVTPAGARLELCGQYRGCELAGVAAGTVRVVDGTGSNRAVSAGLLEDAEVVDAGFAADGESVWVLLVRPDTAEVSLGTIRPDGGATIVATVPIRERMDVEQLRIAGMTADDSIIVISAWRTNPNSPPGILSIVVPTASGGARPTYHDGVFAGFMPSRAVDAIPGTTFGPGFNADPSAPEETRTEGDQP